MGGKEGGHSLVFTWIDATGYYYYYYYYCYYYYYYYYYY